MAFQTEVFEGQFKITDEGVVEFTKALEGILSVSDRVATSLNKLSNIKINMPKVNVDQAISSAAASIAKVSEAADNASKSLENTTTSMARDIETIRRIDISPAAENVASSTKSIRDNLVQLSAITKNTFGEVSTAVGQGLGSIGQRIDDFAPSLRDPLHIGDILGTVKTAFDEFGNEIVRDTSATAASLGNSITTPFRTVFTRLTDTVKSGTDDVKQAFGFLTNDAKVIINDFGTAIKTTGTTVATAFDRDIVQPITTQVKRITNPVREEFNSVKNFLVTDLGGIKESITSGIIAPFKEIQFIPTPFDKIFDDIRVSSQLTFQALSKGGREAGVVIKDMADQVRTNIVTNFQQASSQASESITRLANSVKEKFTALTGIGKDPIIPSVTAATEEPEKAVEATPDSNPKLESLIDQFDRVRDAADISAVTIQDRFRGVSLVLSGSGNRLQGIREAFAGTASSSNLLVKSLDFLIARNDPLAGLSSNLAKTQAQIASEVDKANRALSTQGAILKETIVAELGNGAAVVEGFTKQITRVDSSFKQLAVTASRGGDISGSLLRARQEVEGLETEFGLLVSRGVIPVGSQSHKMFLQVIADAKNNETALQAITQRYKATKEEIAATKKAQDQQAASGQKQVSIFGQISIKLGNLFSVFRSSSSEINNTTNQLKTVENQLKQTSIAAEVMKGSFLGAFGGTLLANFTSGLGRIAGFLGPQFVELNDKIQNTRITIQNMLEGSGIDAEAAVAGFTKFVEGVVAKTPFEFANAIDASLKLAQQGFDPQIWLNASANAAAAVGKPMEQFIGALTKLQAGAKGAAVDQLRDFGLNVNQVAGYFDKATGAAVSFADVAKAQAAGTLDQYEKLNFQFDKQGSLTNSTGESLQILNAYLSQNATFAKAAEARSQSLTGVMSNLKDSVSKILIAAGQPIFEKLTTGAAGILTKLNALTPTLEYFANLLGQRVGTVIDFVAGQFENFTLLSGNLPQPIANAILLIQSLFEGDWVNAWTTFQVTVIDALNSAVGYLADFGASAFDWGANLISQLAQGIFDTADSLLQEAMNYVGGIVASFLQPGSPPEEGPLSTIDEWGEGLMGTMTASMDKVNTKPLESGLDKIRNVFDRFDLTTAKQDVLGIQEQIRQAEEKGFVPAELKKQLTLAQDKVALIEQQAALQEQLANAEEKTSKQKEKGAGDDSAGGSKAGAGGGAKGRVEQEKKTAQQVRDDALSVLDQQLKQGVISYEDYANKRLKIEEKFNQDTLEAGEKVTDQNIKDIKFFQSEVDRIKEGKKKKKGGDEGDALFTPTSIQDIFSKFAGGAEETVQNVGEKVGERFVAAIKFSTTKSMDTFKETLSKKFNEISGKVTETVGTLFDKIRESIPPSLIPVVAIIVGWLVRLAAGPIIAGLVSAGTAIAAIASSFLALAATLSGFLIVGLIVTTIFLHWDTISAEAAKGIEFLNGIFDNFVEKLGGAEKAKEKFLQFGTTLKDTAIEIGNTILQALSDVVIDFDFSKAIDRFKGLGQDQPDIIGRSLGDGSSLIDQFNELVKPLGEAVSEAFSTAFQTVKDALPPEVVSQITSITESFKAFFGQGRLGGELVNLFVQLKELFITLLPVFKSAGIVLAIVGGIILNVLVSAFQGLAAALPFVEQALAGIIRAITGVIDFFTGLSLLVQAGWAAITGDTSTAGQLFQQALQNMGSAVTNIFSGILQTIIGVGAGILTFIISFVGNFLANIFAFIPGFQNVGLVIRAVTNEMINIILGLSSRAIAIMSGLVNQLQIILPAAWNFLIGSISSFVDSVIGFFSNLYQQLVGGSIVPDMVEDIITWFVDLKDRAISTISQFVTNSIEALKAKVDKFVDAGKEIIHGVLKGLQDNQDKILEFLKDLAFSAIDTVKDALGISSPSTVFADLGVNVIKGLNQGLAAIAPNFDTIVGASEDAAEEVLDNMGFENDKAKFVIKHSKVVFRKHFDEIIKLGERAGGELLTKLLGDRVDLDKAGISGEGGKNLGLAMQEFVKEALKQQTEQPVAFAKEQIKLFDNIQKAQEETIKRFNEQVFNIRSFATESRIGLEKLFNRTVTDSELKQLAQSIKDGVSYGKEADQLIQNSLLGQEKLNDALEQEAKIRQAISKFGLQRDKIDELKQVAGLVTTAASSGQAVGNSILKGLGLGIDASVADVFASLANVSDGIIDKLKTNLGIASPSKITAGFGENLMSGMSEGILRGLTSVRGALGAANQTILSGLNFQGLNRTSFSNLATATALPGDLGQLGRSGQSLQLIQHNTISDDYDFAVFTDRTHASLIELMRTGR